MATATSAATALTPSSLSSLLARHARVSLTIPILLPISKPISQYTLISNSPHKLRAKSNDDGQSFFFRDPAGLHDDNEEIPEEQQNQVIEQEVDEEEEEAFIPPITPPEGFTRIPYYDEGPEETEEEIARAYEELYGPVYSSESFLGNDVFVMDSKKKSAATSKPRDGLEERVVQVRRVNKVVKGGRQLNFRAIVIVGDKKCNVGVGVGKAKEVVTAVQKAVVNAKRNLVTIPLTKYSTFPHRAQGKDGAASVMLRPASPGTGVIAGGSVRVVLEMAGVQNALGKQLGSKNPLNNARATVAAAMQMRQFSDVARQRGIPMEELWK